MRAFSGPLRKHGQPDDLKAASADARRAVLSPISVPGPAPRVPPDTGCRRPKRAQSRNDPLIEH
jgi:hypothetical protein